MSANRQSEEKRLAPSEKQMSAGARSTLASRGLDLASLLRRPKDDAQRREPESDEIFLPARKIIFPVERSMGILFLRQWNNQVITKEDEWQELGEARGQVTIPPRTELMLDLAHAASGDLFPLSALGPMDLQRIAAANTQLDDQGLKCLQKLTGLIELWLMGTKITDKGLSFMQSMNGLRILNLSGTCVTDTGLQYLRGLTKLVWLFLDGTQISDVGLLHVKNLTNLEMLSLSNTQVTDAGSITIKNVLPKVQIFL